MTEEEFLTTAHEYGFETRENGRYQQIIFYNLEDRMVLLAEWNPNKERDLWSRNNKDGSPIWFPAGMVCAWSIIPQQDVNGVSYDVGTLSTEVRFSQLRKFKPWVEYQAEKLKHIKKEIRKEEIKYTEFTL
jgi:hypothetical protein